MFGIFLETDRSELPEPIHEEKEEETTADGNTEFLQTVDINYTISLKWSY